MSGGAFLFGLWDSSASAAALILTALLLRALFRERIPRRAVCLLWDVCLARLLIPGKLSSPVSVWQYLPASVSAGVTAAGPVPAPGLAVPGGIPAAGGTAVLPGAAVQAAPLPDGGTVLAAVWLAAALLLAAWFLWGHLCFRRLRADSLPREDGFVRTWLAEHPLVRRIRVRTSDRVAAPLTYGVLRPVILLPAGADWGNGAALSWVMEHEYQHIRRFDTLRKALLAAALCLHWFDPLVWVLYVLCNRDMELACDEGVTGGGADRAGYARTLLDLEERRGRWGLSGSHFSQNALEERIRSIMRQKRFSKTALAAVLIVMTIAATVFAAAAAEDGGEDSSGQSVSGTGDARYQAVEGEVLILSQGGEDGEKQYSLDGGRTWLSEEQYRARYGGEDWQVEWWTAEDYAAWLEEEKQALQSIIGERGYTSDEGWFTWDQKRVDEAVALYEGILNDIQNGALYSKSITDKNGDAVEEVFLGSGTLSAGEVLAVAEEDSSVTESSSSSAAPAKAVDEKALLEGLKAFGVNGSGGQLTYHGQRVRRLVDGVRLGEEGYAIRYLYTDPEGTVDVHTLRAPVYNGDGSYDPMGALTGAASAGEPGFDQALIDGTFSSGGVQTAVAEGSSEPGGRTFEEIFAQYAPYGLVYAPRESGMGSLTWNGRAVRSFADQTPGGGTFSYQDPYTEEGLRVYAEYDEAGRLTGLRAEP